MGLLVRATTAVNLEDRATGTGLELEGLESENRDIDLVLK